ncbi:hypothetical protein MJ904_08420 [Massilia sp. MB5]|uniref:hypothetical protein n=1 Tax=unclassified Massilia TaxID=2609279 RepID=UPI00067DBA3C|nr:MULTISPECIES: hypothetical protein [unclassified Massilia]AKU22959.1 hypothetical protein ACZ75_17360 [Massilia sp. NR 4-1]UMR32183.1 hypothetical protein MJ904_08420 [Massilia sp. MB5]
MSSAAHSYRPAEFDELQLQARWLDAEHARRAYAYALQYAHPRHYGLNGATVDQIEQHLIASRTVARAWLATRLSAVGTVQIVFGDDEVCVVPAAQFLASWDQLFVPSRDDAIILHNLDQTVLFYCHEEELEIGQRRTV